MSENAAFTSDEHVHSFVTFPEGEAICFGCGDLYIFQMTLPPDEVEEYRKYAEEANRAD